jgi:hypothetical protein
MATVTAPSALMPLAPRTTVRPPVSLLVPLWFSLTLLLSSTLLFLVQPLFARMVLPLLGGTPAVWNTCMVFYQAALLVGYAYAHLLTRLLSVRWQILLHSGLLLLPFLALPIAVADNWAPPGDRTPIPWLLALLAVSVGLPFAVVSTSAPLLQRWFAGTGHPSGRDPYFLYAASNLGSMTALLCYPLLMEPLLALQYQSLLWSAGYTLLALCILGCGLLRWYSCSTTEELPESTSALPGSGVRPTLKRRLHWLALALVPSSLLLGVTTHLTTDIAALPLLWILPLALYLLTFILVFSRLGPVLHPWMIRLLAPLLLGLLATTISNYRPGLLLDIGLHLVVFFVLTMVCHGELARLRPAPEHLTEYYLLMSVGGVLGGLFNALVAPVWFTMTLEFPLALVAVCLLKPTQAPTPERTFSLGRHGLLLFVLAGWTAVMVAVENHVDLDGWAKHIGAPAVLVFLVLGYLTPLVGCYFQSRWSFRFASCVAVVLLAGYFCREAGSPVHYRTRSFFGQITVRPDPQRQHTWFLHGSTLHGIQSLDPARRQEPLAYFHRTGPLGQLFAALAGPRAPKNVGVTGLGIGTLAAYALPGQSWTFYEIDPAVEQVARDARYFNYLEDCENRGVDLAVVLGDARLQLKAARSRVYDLLVLDAFSSDSIPIHLVTRQALALYLDKLAENGVLVFNISNRYIDLEPVLARLADDAGLVGYVQHDSNLAGHPGKFESSYVVLARQPQTLERLGLDQRWKPLVIRPGTLLWTDDFSNLIGVLKLR